MEDKALCMAAREGNTSKLKELLNEDPLLLDKVKPLFTETPLHIAALAGHADFVKILLQRTPNLARQQSNREGLNGLHIAAAKGHVDVAAVLLQIDNELDLIGDIEGSIPLHYAAYHGMVEVARLMVSKKPVVLKWVNIKGETALHVAVKSKQLQFAKVLTEALHDLEVGWSDGVVKYAEDKNKIHNLEVGWSDGVVKYAEDENKIHDLEVGCSDGVVKSAEDENKILQSFVACNSQTEFPIPTHAQAYELLQPCAQKTCHVDAVADANHQINSEIINVMLQLLKKKIARGAMLVVGILIATVTFQAMMNPPQSMWKGGMANEKKIDKFYIFFLACNSVCFFAGCVTVFAALKKDTSVLNFWVSSSLTWAAANFICVLISMMEKVVIHKVITASLFMVIPNVIISLFLYSRKVKRVMRSIKVYAQL